LGRKIFLGLPPADGKWVARLGSLAYLGGGVNRGGGGAGEFGGGPIEPSVDRSLLIVGRFRGILFTPAQLIYLPLVKLDNTGVTYSETTR
jgi:hypothetical protein